MNKTKFGSLLLLLQGILLILFVVFVDYGDDFKPNIKNENRKDFNQKLPAFQDLHIMVFLGFGLIMTFLKRYSRGMLVHAFLIGGLVIQWATLLQGFFSMRQSKVELTLDRMINADYAVLVVLVSLGALIGKVNSLQLLIIALIETIFFAINESLCKQLLQISDFGQSMTVHLFGAIFGIAISRMIFDKRVCTSQALSTSNKSEMYSMIGTLFLWIYFPSLNSAFVEEDSAHRRAIANTYYALAASCITSFSLTVLQSPDHRYNILHLQNATITGGIAIGSVAALMVRPWGAIILGVLASLISILTYKYILPKLRRRFNIHDVRGVYATHGMPGIVSGLAAVVCAFLANEEHYGTSLYQLYPARVPSSNTTKYQDLIKIHPEIPASQGRSAYIQGAYQFGGLLVTVILALIGGLISGASIRVKFFEPLTAHDAFDDHADFQESTCIDVYTDDDFEDDGERHHDSIRGNKRLYDLNHRHPSDDVISGDGIPQMTSYNSGRQTPSSVRHSYHSLSAKSSDGVIKGSRELPVDDNENVKGGKVNLGSNGDMRPAQNGGIEMTPLIVVADNSDVDDDGTAATS
ncbi:ammonium transporter Rh type B-like [Clytia hemisphaerica]|uniref:Ammonium transporter AmtB-like domain-containing protein n=1 Tax=Clytia hemisphaerica TaxID=252671 RepID=A0A7M5XBY8_9CNID